MRRAVPLRISGQCKELKKELFGYRVRLSSVREVDHTYEEVCGEPRQQLSGRFPARPISVKKERQLTGTGLLRSVSCSVESTRPMSATAGKPRV